MVGMFGGSVLGKRGKGKLRMRGELKICGVRLGLPKRAVFFLVLDRELERTLALGASD